MLLFAGGLCCCCCCGLLLLLGPLDLGTHRGYRECNSRYLYLLGKNLQDKANNSIAECHVFRLFEIYPLHIKYILVNCLETQHCIRCTQQHFLKVVCTPKDTVGRRCFLKRVKNCVLNKQYIHFDQLHFAVCLQDIPDTVNSMQNQCKTQQDMTCRFHCFQSLV